MSEETQSTVDETPEATLTPEVVEDGAPPESINEPELFKFFNAIKANPKNFTNQQIIDTLFTIAKDDVWACFDARLKETAAMKFNLVQMAFTTLSKILLNRHGIVPQVQGQTVQSPQPGPQQSDTKLVSLA